MPNAPIPEPNIPAETSQAAREVFNLQHVYMQIGDRLNELMALVDLPALDPSSSLSGDALLRVLLVTAFQYAEGLPDVAASEATLRRMDWKYALYLPVRHPGLGPALLGEFRHNLYHAPKGLEAFGRLLERLAEIGLFSHLSGGAPEPTEVLNTVCQITRLHRLNQAFKSALSMLVAVDPDWLRANMLPHWYERFSTGGLRYLPLADSDDLLRQANALGTEIDRLTGLLREQNKRTLLEQPEIEIILCLLDEEYTREPAGVQWKQPKCVNSACSHIGEQTP